MILVQLGKHNAFPILKSVEKEHFAWMPLRSYKAVVTIWAAKVQTLDSLK